MRKKQIRTVRLRRKREGKTNYRKRLLLLKSRKNRLVVRKTLTALVVQLVSYIPSGDSVLCSATMQDLKKAGWVYSAKNTPAAYLLGVALAKKALALGVKDAVVDFGLQKVVKGSKLYATVKGCIDGGLAVNCSKEVFPSKERLMGTHIASHHEKAKDITAAVTKTKEILLK